jgi:hypothetical protein
MAGLLPRLLPRGAIDLHPKPTCVTIPCIHGHKMEPAIQIERTTCGLRISPDPHSDDLTPQETTNQDAPDMGADGAGLSCPGSSVVAEQGEQTETENRCYDSSTGGG